MSNWRWYTNVTCCLLMLLATVFDLALDLYEEALFCFIVALFTGFNAWIETKTRA